MARTARILGLSLVLGMGLAAAAASKPAQVAPAAQPFRVGSLQLVALRDADNVLDNDGQVFGVGVGPAAVTEVLKQAGAPTDQISLSVDALLVKAPGRVMLFDTGLGPGVHGALMGSLAQAGVTPAQVTDVFITHSHGDHVGGLATADGKLAFPNAAIHMSAAEWAWMQAAPNNKELAALIAPQVRPFEPGAVLAPGVTAVVLPGHTPGHSGYEIRSGRDSLLDVGDLAHSSVISLAKPDWAIQYDTDRATGAATRHATLTRLAASHQLVFAPHFPFPGVGRIAAQGDGFTWRPGLQ